MSQQSDHLFTPDEIAEDAAADAERQARQNRVDQLRSKGWSGTASYTGDQLIILSAKNIPDLEDQLLYPVQPDTPRFSSKGLLAKGLTKSTHYVHAQYSAVFADYLAAAIADPDYHSIAHSRFTKELLSYGKQLITEGDPAVAATDFVLASISGPSRGKDSFCAAHGWCSHTLPTCRLMTDKNFQKLSHQIKGFRAAEMLRYAHPLAVLTFQQKRAPAAAAAAAPARQQPSTLASDAPAPAVHAAVASKRKGVPSVAGPLAKQQRALCSGSQGQASAAAAQVLVVPTAVSAAPAAAVPVAAVSTHPAGSMQATSVDGVPGQVMSFTETMFLHATQMSHRFLDDKEEQLRAALAELREVKAQLQLACVHRDKYRSERDSARMLLQEEKQSAAYYRQQVVDADNRLAAQRSPQYANSNV